MAKYKQQKTKIKIAKSHKPKDRVSLAKEIIEFIQKRSSQGKDKNNRRFASYKKSYTSSKQFRDAGKSASPVDLLLSGEMLNSMELLTHRSGSVTIGFKKGDDDLNGKVEGNRKGTYGNSSRVQKPRDFLGITKKALTKLEKDNGQ